MNSLLRGAEDGLVNAVNPFSELRDVWDRYATVISMLHSVNIDDFSPTNVLLLTVKGIVNSCTVVNRKGFVNDFNNEVCR